jgi:hypothetical protein
MNRTRVCHVSALALAGVMAAELSAFAQVPPPAAAPPPPPPPAAEAPPPPVVAAPMAPAPMPRSADDMTGSIGFGVGVIPNMQLVGTNGQVAIKYWVQDNLALVPALNLGISKSMGTDAAWVFNPEVVVLYTPFKVASTRFQIGGGLGFGVGKTPPATDTAFTLNLPIQGGVEHFFTRWFSMGIAARTNLFQYTKLGDAWTTSIAINTTSLLGQLFFYTD